MSTQQNTWFDGLKTPTVIE